MESFNCRVLDHLVHSFNLTVRPRMVWLGHSVFDPISLTDQIEKHWPRMDGISVSGLFSELDAPRHCLSDQWRSNGSINVEEADSVVLKLLTLGFVVTCH